MTKELLYTSAPKGLKPGSSGFCTVLSTKGMPTPLTSALESISAYRHVFPPGEQQAEKNPISYSHLLLSIARNSNHVISRVADYGLDYSQRTNKIAHHVVLEQSELISAGPAWLLESSKLLRKEWSEQPRLTPPGPAPEPSDRPLSRCEAWQAMTGDAGWAGVLAESFLSNSQQPVYLIFEPGMDLLPLIVEAISLLPPKKRWDVTFSTYFTTLPQNAKCQWRCVLKDSPEANESRRFVRSLRIDLTEDLGSASGGERVEAARTGKLPIPEDSRLRTGDLETQTSSVQFAEYQGGVEPYQLAGAKPTGGPSTQRPPVRPGRRRSAGDGSSFSPASKLFLAALLLVVFVGGAVGLVKLFSTKVDEGALVAQSDENKSESPDSNSPESPMTQEQKEENEGRLGSSPPMPPAVIPEPRKSTTDNQPKDSGPGDTSPVAPQVAGEDPQNPTKPIAETPHNSKKNESGDPKEENPKSAELTMIDRVKYHELPKDPDTEGGLPNISAKEDGSWWKQEVQLIGKDNKLPANTAIKSIELHIDKTDNENFDNKFQQRNNEMSLVLEEIDQFTQKPKTIAMFKYDRGEVKFQFRDNPSVAGRDELIDILSRSLLEVQLVGSGQHFIAFKKPHLIPESINANSSATTNTSSDLLNSGKVKPVSWNVMITDKLDSKAYGENIQINDVTITTFNHTLHFQRDSMSRDLVLHGATVEVFSKLIDAVQKIQNPSIFPDAKLVQVALQTSHKDGNIIVRFETLYHANEISVALIKQIKRNVQEVRRSLIKEKDTPGNEDMIVPKDIQMSIDKPSGFEAYKEYLNDLKILLEAMKAKVPETQQQDNPRYTAIGNALTGVNNALELMPHLKVTSEQLQTLNTEFANAKITGLTAYREFPLPDDRKTKFVTIEVLELDSEESKEK